MSPTRDPERRTKLQDPTPQHDAVRASIARALRSLDAGPDVRLSLRDLWFGPLSTVSGPEVCGGGELVAGVLGRFHGRLPSIGLYAMEPEEALALLQAGFEACEPLAAYVALGSEVLHGVAAALSGCSGAAVPGGEIGGRSEAVVYLDGECVLVEDSVTGTLLRTHAPSDTTVVGLGLDVEAGEARLRAHVYMLVEPKLFAGVLASVAHP